MLVYDWLLIQKLIASIVVGYLLGSIPFAHMAARLKGIDIFTTGNFQAGTANVFWNISRRTGLIVFICDVAKGSVSVLIADLLGIPPYLLVIAGAAAVLGHWKSLFTGFKGGDGMASLLGVTLTITPMIAIPCILVGFATVIISWKSTFRSATGIASCFSLLMFLSFYIKTDTNIAIGLTLLATLVLFHNLIIKKRIAGHSPEDDLDNLDVTEEPATLESEA
ncbi:MAG: hypothetical protein CL886_06805 [Dehalococcoidia bacterium]|nr:hypothetical protein [Dehalococcoidia bacterium]